MREAPTGPVTASTGTQAGAHTRARPSARRITWMVLWVAGSAAVLVTLYYLLPLDHSSTPAAVTIGTR